jgi:hypothetical protein
MQWDKADNLNPAYHRSDWLESEYPNLYFELWHRGETEIAKDLIHGNGVEGIQWVPTVSPADDEWRQKRLERLLWQHVPKKTVQNYKIWKNFQEAKAFYNSSE